MEGEGFSRPHHGSRSRPGDPKRSRRQCSQVSRPGFRTDERNPRRDSRNQNAAAHVPASPSHYTSGHSTPLDRTKLGLLRFFFKRRGDAFDTVLSFSMHMVSLDPFPLSKI